jgi:hypothetical protein
MAVSLVLKYRVYSRVVWSRVPYMLSVVLTLRVSHVMRMKEGAHQ